MSVPALSVFKVVFVYESFTKQYVEMPKLWIAVYIIYTYPKLLSNLQPLKTTTLHKQG